MNPSFLTGGKVVMISSTRPKKILEAIEKERVTTMILVCGTAPADGGPIPISLVTDLSSLQVIAGAGSHVPAELIHKIYERLGCNFYNVYGSSEGPCAQTRYGRPARRSFSHTVRRMADLPLTTNSKVIDSNGNGTLPQGQRRGARSEGPLAIFRRILQIRD